MKFGLLKDIKEGEYRVLLTPLEIAAIVSAGHPTFVQKDAGKAAGFPNEAYMAAGATIIEMIEIGRASCRKRV